MKHFKVQHFHSPVVDQWRPFLVPTTPEGDAAMENMKRYTGDFWTTLGQLSLKLENHEMRGRLCLRMIDHKTAQIPEKRWLDNVKLLSHEILHDLQTVRRLPAIPDNEH